jgi:hypothetical protein
VTSTFGKGDRVRLTVEGTVTYASAYADEMTIDTDAGEVYLEYSKPAAITVEVISPTAREQFEALPIGTIFRTTGDIFDTDDRVKITPTQYTYLRPRPLELGATTLFDVTSAVHWWNRGGRDETLIVKTEEVK